MVKKCFKRMGTVEKEEYIKKATILFFVYSGFWKSKSNHQLNSPLVIFHLIVLLSASFGILYMFAIKMYDDIDINVEAFMHLVQILDTVGYHLLIIFKKKSLDNLSEILSLTADKMKLPVRDRIKHSAMLQKERDSFVRVMVCMICLTLITYSCVISESVVLYFTVGKKQLLYHTWFPFETDSDNMLPYMLGILFELLIYADVLLIRSAVWLLWFWTIHLVSGILSIIGSCLKSLDIEKRGKYSEDTWSVNEHPKSILGKCINLHVLARRLVSELNLSIAIAFFELVITFEISICFAGFHVIEAARTGELYRMVKFFLGAVLFSQILYVSCAMGQKLIDKSEEFYQNIYSCGWQDQDQSVKNSLHICQTVAKKPLMLRARHFKATLHTFLVSMRAVYSYLNFLEAMKDKS